MQFENAPLNQCDEGLRACCTHVHRRSAAFRHLDAIDRGVDTLARVFLIEALPVPAIGTAHQRQWATFDVREDPWRDTLMVLRDVGLGDARFGKVELVRV